MENPAQTFKRHLKGLIHAIFPVNPWFILLFPAGKPTSFKKVFLSYPFKEDFLTEKMAVYLVPKLPYHVTEPVYRRDVQTNLSESTVFILHDLTIPLEYGNRRIGLFWVGSQKREGFSVKQRESVVQLAALMGFMMGVFASYTQQTEELLYSELRFHDVVEHLDEAVFIMNERELVYVNTSFCALVSSVSSRVLGTPFQKWVHPDDWGAFSIRMRRMMAGEPFPDDYELRLRGEDGEARLCLFSLRKIRNTNEDLFAGSLRDITNIEAIRGKLFEAQKMSALSTFSAGIAHDFNNILGGILGYASLIKSELLPNERLYPFVESIEQSSQRAAKLIQQLMGFTSGGRFQEIPFVLQGTLQWLKEIAAGLMGESVVISLEMTGEPLTVFGDMDQVRQAFLNICMNARDAMPRGGMLKIKLSKQRIPPLKYPSVQPCLPGLYARIDFQDTGVGMNEAVLEKIFDPFFTTKEVGKGTGLGLSMTYGIIKGHGGCIEVESAPGKGALFRIYLPLYESTQSDLPKNDREGYLGRGERILVVDNDQELDELIQLELEQNGYQVTLARSAQEGLEAYRKTRANPFDLVVLEMNMPVMDGEVLFWKLKEIDPKVKVILLTGFTIDGKVRNLLYSGVLGYLHKPFHRLELLRAVRTGLDSGR